MAAPSAHGVEADAARRSRSLFSDLGPPGCGVARVSGNRWQRICSAVSGRLHFYRLSAAPVSGSRGVVAQASASRWSGLRNSLWARTPTGSPAPGAYKFFQGHHPWIILRITMFDHASDTSRSAGRRGDFPRRVKISNPEVSPPARAFGIFLSSRAPRECLGEFVCGCAPRCRRSPARTGKDTTTRPGPTHPWRRPDSIRPLRIGGKPCGARQANVAQTLRQRRLHVAEADRKRRLLFCLLSRLSQC